MYQASDFMSLYSNLWIDSFNPNIIYIFSGGLHDRKKCKIKFVDIRENDESITYCYTASGNDKLDQFYNTVTLGNAGCSYMTHF